MWTSGFQIDIRFQHYIGCPYPFLVIHFKYNNVKNKIIYL